MKQNNRINIQTSKQKRVSKQNKITDRKKNDDLRKKETKYKNEKYIMQQKINFVDCCRCPINYYLHEY